MEPRGAPAGKPRRTGGEDPGGTSPLASPSRERVEALRELFSTRLVGAEDRVVVFDASGLPKLPRAALRRIGWVMGVATVVLLLDLSLVHRPTLALAATLASTLVAVLWGATAVALVRLDADSKLRTQGRLESVRTGLAWVVLGVLGALVAASLVSRLLVAVDWQRRLEGSDRVTAFRTWSIAGYLAMMLGLLGRPGRLQRLAARVADHQARLMALSFGITALLGALLLSLPISVRDLSRASFVDALFMAASAVSVTGLTTVDPSSTYTPFGQAVLLVLIQAGGLGIMVLYGFLALAVGRDLGLQGSTVMAQTVDTGSLATLRGTVFRIVGLSLVIEAVGTACLWVAFGAYPEMAGGPDPERPLAGPGSRLWAAAFHAVSAFTNAGFSLFPRGLQPLAGDWLVQVVVIALVVLGGLGFPVLFELGARWKAWRRRRRAPRLSLHTRTALVTSALLLAVGTVLFLALEWSRSLGHLPPHGRFLGALFQSAMLRTAGFQTVDYAAMGSATLLFACALMFVGGSPGGTAGGVKTTTLAVLFATLWAELRRKDQVVLFDRAVSPSTSRRALGVVLVSAAGAFAFSFTLLLLQPGVPPLFVLIEAFSALNTVGVSAGATAELGTAGKLLVAVAMLAGRIGPLTLALALATEAPGNRLARPEERVGIG